MIEQQQQQQKCSGGRDTAFVWEATALSVSQQSTKMSLFPRAHCAVAMTVKMMFAQQSIPIRPAQPRTAAEQAAATHSRSTH
ncbi:hypothetical protein AC579_9473 [Pseudocercospora musae]|uniref:Uncharacterized protein n=1 Tax=Pseudocercospora musae TaxID=113226 RepID=A0A139I9D4_9PEZI|nr:hypothetical protein AC579_9473 [Pseudocercospora musae]